MVDPNAQVVAAPIAHGAPEVPAVATEVEMVLVEAVWGEDAWTVSSPPRRPLLPPLVPSLCQRVS